MGGHTPDIRELAEQIDTMSYDFDPYEYRDGYDEAGGALPDIERMLREEPAELANRLDEMTEYAADDNEREKIESLAKQTRELANEPGKDSATTLPETLDDLRARVTQRETEPTRPREASTQPIPEDRRAANLDVEAHQESDLEIG